MLQEDVKAAVEYAEGQIRRLLSGQVELWELPLTGGLWRVTGVFSILQILLKVFVFVKTKGHPENLLLKKCTA